MRISSRLLIVIGIVLALAGSRFAPLAARGAAGPADLDALLAPVALYPDQLLAQMLLCAGNPAMVGTLSNIMSIWPEMMSARAPVEPL